MLCLNMAAAEVANLSRISPVQRLLLIELTKQKYNNNTIVWPKKMAMHPAFV